MKQIKFKVVRPLKIQIKKSGKDKCEARSSPYEHDIVVVPKRMYTYDNHCLYNYSVLLFIQCFRRVKFS